MKRIPLTKHHIISEDECDYISEALETAALALGQSLVEEGRMLRMIETQSIMLQGLMDLQQSIVDTINASAEEGLSIDELRERMLTVLGEFVEAA